MANITKRDNEGNDTKVKRIAGEELKYKKLSETVKWYLEELDVPFVESAYDQILYDQCIEYMVVRGWSESTQKAARIFLLPSLVMSVTAYTHLSNEAQIYVSIYTTLMIYLDDIISKENMGMLKSFASRLFLNKPQELDVLDAIVGVLGEAPEHFGDFSGSMILSSTLRYITAIVIEEEVAPSAETERGAGNKFPRYLRELSGIPEAYAVFIFPPSIPYTVFVQAIPDMIGPICFGNDVLSLYKEELKGDESNMISLLAKSKQMSKLEVHRQVTEEALQSDRAVLKLLGGNREATDAWMNFRRGYIAFHTCLSRYRLRELLEL